MLDKLPDHQYVIEGPFYYNSSVYFPGRERPDKETEKQLIENTLLRKPIVFETGGAFEFKEKSGNEPEE
jgi:hypothetical protein